MQVPRGMTNGVPASFFSSPGEDEDNTLLQCQISSGKENFG